MKFAATLTILAFAAAASANVCGEQCPSKRSINLTNKPREWLNAVRGVEVATPVDAPVDAPAKE